MAQGAEGDMAQGAEGDINVWAPWESWSPCSATCGSGLQTRSRGCIIYNENSAECPDNSDEQQTCEQEPCFCAIQSTDHEGWTINLNGALVKFSVGDNVTAGTVINRDCSLCECIGTNLTCIPKDCQYCRYTEWEEWTDCSKSCDAGQRLRSRELLPLQNWDMCVMCNESREDIENCNTNACSGWSTWQQWSECSAKTYCAFGTRTRERTCIGTACEEEGLEIETCGETCPPLAELNCTDNRVWSSCATHDEQTCGGLLNFFTEGDTACHTGCVCEPGFISQTTNGQCIPESSCPCYTEDGKPVEQGNSVVQGCTTCSCNGANQQLDCITSTSCCDWGQWTSWGSCDVTCGTGTSQRYRELTSGENCGPSTEAKTCSVDCPKDCDIDGRGYSCGEITLTNSTHTCYCTVGNTTSCVKKPRNDTCLKYTKTEILYDAIGDCRTIEAVPVDYCTGSCGNSTYDTVLVYSTLSDGGQSTNCPCCTGTYYDEKEPVQVKCGQDVEIYTAYLPRIRECSCTPCRGVTSVYSAQ